ncbi:hypothetical protein ACLRDI_14275 [Pseudomonas piscis]|uniref:hypothetical protein n=1 Tax=Pseudomonas piscis TaxID=2614538 RepID=UPI0039A5BDB9
MSLSSRRSFSPRPISLCDPHPGRMGRDSMFNVRSGISAEEALVHVSMLLKAAEEVSDEITKQASGVERGLIWSLVHSVEMARGVVDALLDGHRLSSD